MSRIASRLRSHLVDRPWLQAALLTAVGFAALSPSLGAGFLWDDFQQVVDSPTIADPTAPVRYFSLNVVESWGSSGRGGDGIDTYRPLFFVTLWLVHRIAGADPFWYHLAALTAHLGFCLLLWTAARRWVASTLAAAAVFLVVAIHPVTAEAFLWASAISEALAAAGLVGAALIVDRWCRDGGNHWIAAAVAGLVTLAGLLTKEVVVAALPMVSLYLWRVRGVRARFLTGPWLAVVAFVVLRIRALDGLQATGSDPEQRIAALQNLPVLVVDGLRALVTLQPVGIRHLYWDYRGITLTGTTLAAAVILVLAAAAWRVRRRLPLTPTALGVTICMLAPVAFVTTAPGWGGFGRYLYLPLAFCALAAAEAGRRLGPVLAAAAPRLRGAIGLVVAFFLVFEGLGLRHALAIFSSQESLARAAVEVQPNAPEGWEWLGNHYIATGDLANAALCYAEAVAIEPAIYRSHHNLAAALLYLGRPAEALEHEIAVRRDHGITADGTFVAVSALVELGSWDGAGAWLLAGLDQDPTSAGLRDLQARLLRDHPDPESYRAWLEAQIAAAPDRPAGAVIRPLLR